MNPGQNIWILDQGESCLGPALDRPAPQASLRDATASEGETPSRSRLSGCAQCVGHVQRAPGLGTVIADGVPSHRQVLAAEEEEGERDFHRRRDWGTGHNNEDKLDVYMLKGRLLCGRPGLMLVRAKHLQISAQNSRILGPKSCYKAAARALQHTASLADLCTVIWIDLLPVI